MFPRKVIALVVAALVALVAAGWVSDQSTRTMKSSLQSVNHTRDVLITEGECRTSLLRAESSGRAYALTGEPAFAADSERAIASVRDRVAQLRRLTADNAVQQQALAGVSVLVNRRVDLLRTLAAEKSGGANLAALQSVVMSGTAVNAELDRALDGVHAEEIRLLTERTRRAESAEFVAIFAPWAMIVIAAIVTAILLLQVYVAFKGEYEARRRSEAARIRAEESDRLKDDFLATVSHELRTPLTAIVGWAGLLQVADARAELLDTAIANISAAAKSQSRLIDDLLDVSRIITGTMKLDIATVDLRHIVDEAVASVAPSARAKEIAIRVSSAPGITGVRGDASRLLQVVWNLLSNAVKFTRPGGHVDVQIQPLESHVEISVTDTGEGIAPEFVPHVFDRFRQAETGPTRRTAGLGLGLAIVKQLVELHGGSVRVSSPGVGRGATFTVELPMMAGAEAGGGGAPQLSGRRIIVIEDDDATLQLIATIIARTGAFVVTAQTTAAAMPLFPVDVIVCDIGLPDEDGLSFMRRIRASAAPYAHVPAIAITAYTRPEDRAAALSAGFDGYLAKPITQEGLLFTLAAALTRRADAKPETEEDRDGREREPHAAPERRG